jgi:hypothetical protein
LQPTSSVRVVLIAVGLAFVQTAHSDILISADSRLDAYQLLHEKLGGIPYETPDCIHSEFGPHITQRHDVELAEDVFEFHLHADYDNDRCLTYDRQRTEIKVYDGSASNLKGYEQEVIFYQWRFRLPHDIRPAGYFNHIFQLKPVGENVGGNPAFTFSLLPGDEFALYHDEGNGIRGREDAQGGA